MADVGDSDELIRKYAAHATPEPSGKGPRPSDHERSVRKDPNASAARKGKRTASAGSAGRVKAAGSAGRVKAAGSAGQVKAAGSGPRATQSSGGLVAMVVGGGLLVGVFVSLALRSPSPPPVENEVASSSVESRPRVQAPVPRRSESSDQDSRVKDERWERSHDDRPAGDERGESVPGPSSTNAPSTAHDSSRAESLVADAWRLIENGDLDGATERLAQARSSDPRNPDLDDLDAKIREMRDGKPAAANPQPRRSPSRKNQEPKPSPRPSPSPSPSPEPSDDGGDANEPQGDPQKAPGAAPPSEPPAAVPVKAGEVLEKFADGKVKARYTVDANGNKKGDYVEYYPSGKTQVKAKYRDGVLDGTYTELFENGRPRVKRTYKKGLLEGHALELDETGRIVSDMVFASGRLALSKTPETIAKALAAIKDSACPLPPAGPNKTEFAPLDQGTQANALRRLRAYRYLCDVPTDVDLSYEDGERAQAGCKLLELVGHLEHKPQRPPGCPDNLWKYGFEGTSSCNLHEGLASPTEAVDGFMDDSDPSNVSRVGHRRWCLDPRMKKTAFGMSGKFISMWAMDGSGKDCPPEPEVIAYPARGYFPMSYLAGNAAWSLSLNPRNYAEPRLADVKVSVAPADASFKKGPAVPIDDFNVNTDHLGYPYAVIFRPRIVTGEGARFWVTIKGLKTPAGAAADMEYMVEFFKLSSAPKD